MRDLLVPTSAAPVTVRLRCAPCEVAWSGEADSRCWICDGDGAPLNALVARGGGLLSFESDLFL